MADSINQQKDLDIVQNLLTDDLDSFDSKTDSILLKDDNTAFNASTNPGGNTGNVNTGSLLDKDMMGFGTVQDNPEPPKVPFLTDTLTENYDTYGDSIKTGSDAIVGIAGTIDDKGNDSLLSDSLMKDGGEYFNDMIQNVCEKTDESAHNIMDSAKESLNEFADDLLSTSKKPDVFDNFGVDEKIIETTKTADLLSEPMSAPVPGSQEDLFQSSSIKDLNEGIKEHDLLDSEFSLNQGRSYSPREPSPTINVREASPPLTPNSFTGEESPPQLSSPSNPVPPPIEPSPLADSSIVQQTPEREPSPITREPTPPPREPTPPPREPTPPPREPTPPPREPTPPPREPTPPPREPTPPPREPTPPPREPTPPPREPTPPPREPTPPPKEISVPSVKSSVIEPLKTNKKNEASSSRGRSYPPMDESLKRKFAVFKPVAELIYWRDVKKSGVALGSSLVLLFSLTCFSLISVFAYTALSVLLGAVAFRIYMNIKQAVAKTQDGHPFKDYLAMNPTLPSDNVHSAVDVMLGQLNATLTYLHRIFLVEDLIDSCKFGCYLWVLTYIGAWLNGLTIIILMVIALFSLPKAYEQNKAQVDQYMGLAQAQVNQVLEKVKAVIPIGGTKEKDQ